MKKSITLHIGSLRAVLVAGLAPRPEEPRPERAKVATLQAGRLSAVVVVAREPRPLEPHFERKTQEGEDDDRT